ncbi:MAG: chromate efflux transporter [Spirochaetales bacterium]|nr:chromate efflux transporter [Spirochaetales bacterium]
MTPDSTRNPQQTGWPGFLKDVFICSLGAYGGPEAHLGVFIDQLAVKGRYVREEELLELVALCSILPGPTSTQTIVAVGYRTGGPVLAFLTLLVWAAPILLFMTGLSFLYGAVARAYPRLDIFRFTGAMAVGFIILAALRIGKKVVTGGFSMAVLLSSLFATFFIRTPWIFPLVLVCGGAAAVLVSGKQDLWQQRTKIRLPWRYLIVFTVLAAGLPAVSAVSASPLAALFEQFYRYGYLVFGGGQVVVPVMFTELVDTLGRMTEDEFLAGYGMVQGLPGPMFSFAAYAGGMAARGGPVLYQLAGAAAGAGIFLPGILLVFFVIPAWNSIRGIKGIQVSLKGVNAAAGGMIAAAAFRLLIAHGLTVENLIVTGGTVVLLAARRIPAPLIVAAALVLGLVL